MSGATYDTGMLIALERRKQRALAVHEWLGEEGIRVTAPWVVVAEFWRGRTERRDAILRSIDIEAPSLQLAKNAGHALAIVERATIVDAIVMASAALRGDVVYTSDVDDLGVLQRHFPGVRLLAV
ncbi:MAG: PIN domain-containing protein [Labilithrix sp.]|nr:PIN domain-containing protein [Labilithrix sp.]MBX3213823.1 PIN domain-containing protein [Labilithrix sp.]